VEIFENGLFFSIKTIELAIFIPILINVFRKRFVFGYFYPVTWRKNNDFYGRLATRYSSLPTSVKN
jgi:hypothetical protein